MNNDNSRIAEVVKAIESVASDGYGRMSIPCEMDEDLYEQIQFALTCEPRSQFLLNQFGFDTLLRFVERRASQCLRDPEFEHCQHAAQALEILLFQPEYDEHTVDVALALVHDAYQHLPTPRPEFDARELPLFSAAWEKITAKLADGTTCSEHHFRVGEDQDGPRYICYW